MERDVLPNSTTVSFGVVMSCLFSFTFVLGVCIYEGRYLGRPKEAVRSPGSGIIESCEFPCVCAGLNVGPLQSSIYF